MYRVLVSTILYFSRFSVEPVLFELSTFVKATPSFEVDITKLFCLSFPLNQATLTSQTLLTVPKSSCIHDPTPLLDHLVSKLSSTTFVTGNPV